MTAKTVLFVASVSGFLAVALGAFGAHGLKARVAPELLVTWATGVEYHFYHSLALLLVALFMMQHPQLAALRWSAGAMVAGIAIFSGSLYLLVLTDTRWLGAITPIGGVAFLAGWICLAVAAWKIP